MHIINSPSSFIPFCSFGEEVLGEKVKEFDIPVCNIFKPKILYDQICYESDLELLKKEDTNLRKKQRESGLILVLDYNEDRQINKFGVDTFDQRDMINFSDQQITNSVSIHLNTIGIFFLLGLLHGLWILIYLREGFKKK